MRLVKATYEILSCPANALEMIERAARTCYKSESRINSDSAGPFVKRLIDSGHHAMLEHGGNISVKFISNRGMSHEMVRHRLCSFGQESTRYCSYNSGKFDHEISISDPRPVLSRVKTDSDPESWLPLMIIAWETCERVYMELRSRGCPAELARDVLPIGLKTEIVVTANIREWRTIFEQRTSPRAHPRMRELMRPLLTDLRTRIPVVFDDVGMVD